MNVDNIATLCPKIVFLDFDGVLTDNKVYVNEQGHESVRCDRADGLAINALRILAIPTYIVSTETNPVVSKRAEKLQIPCTQGAHDKAQVIQQLLQKHQVPAESACYVGNDINDYRAMSLCGLRAAPSDSHPKILNIANIPLTSKGGEGVLRELIENKLQLDLVEILYPK